MVRLEHVSHNFGSNWALRDVSLDVGKGDFLFLTGHSGAGKTTLLKLLYAAEPLMRGSALVCGYDLKNLSSGKVPLLRRKIGVVFQDFKVLPHKTVFDNVALALEVRGMARSLIERRVRAVLRVLHIEEKTYVPCGNLSGGEQQRVAIARSVVTNPELILADEPTGNLDSDLSFRLMEVFKQFHAHGTTIIMATHSREILNTMPGSKIIQLHEGQIVAANYNFNMAPAGEPA